jgi:hypothetical protein
MEAWQALVGARVSSMAKALFLDHRAASIYDSFVTPETLARDTLDVWPALPLAILSDGPAESVDDVVAALERSTADRVCRINLKGIPSSHLKPVSAAMKGPFLELTDLLLWSYGPVTALPDSFLGGCAPRLQSLWLNNVLFPGSSLPKLLLSATRLSTLCLCEIPHHEYISPEVMVAVLSTLNSLRILLLEFQSSLSHPDPESRHLPPTRCVLPVLTSLTFRGGSEYLDQFVAHIDAPRLDYLDITFIASQIVFGTQQFIQFISRTPTLKALEKARVTFEDGAARVNLSSQVYGYGELNVKISCVKLDQQLSSLEHVCNSSLPSFFHPGGPLHLRVRILANRSARHRREQPMARTVASIYRCEESLFIRGSCVTHCACPERARFWGRMTGVLPALRNIYLEGSELIQEGIGQFVASRQVTNHPIAITCWIRTLEGDDDDDDEEDND